MKKESPTTLNGKIKGHFKENWGSPFIIAFMLLLIGAAFSLPAGLAHFADAMAIYAFYALLIGVILQLACFLKYRKNLPTSEAVS